MRKKVAQFIQERDGVATNEESIYLTNGASEGVRLALLLLIRNQMDGILIPIPQYPLYSALITLYGGTACGYYLDEEQNWALDPKDLKKRIEQAKRKGINL